MTTVTLEFSLPGAIAIEDHVGSSGGIRLLNMFRPAYLREAKANHVTGTVRLRAVIGEDGAVANLRTLLGDPAWQRRPKKP